MSNLANEEIKQVEELEYKLVEAQKQIEALNKQIEESQSSSLKLVQLERENIRLKTRLDELEKENDVLTMNQQSVSDDNAAKEAIAEVMLEAQQKAREITSNADYEVKEARKLVERSEYELELITREARTYHRQVTDAKTEANRLFEEMLENLDTLKEIKYIKPERGDRFEETE